MNSPWRVSVVSTQEVVTSGLRTMLEQFPDRVVPVELSLGFGADDPDVILYDVIGLHEEGPAELEHLVKETTSAVLVVDRELRPDLGARALALGADGFFAMGVEADELVEQVCLVATAVADPHAEPSEDDVAAAEEREHRLGHDVGLTPREVQILEQITRGLSNQEIALQSYLSINSVKTYIRSAYRRMGVTSRSQAVAWCIQHGFSSDVED